MESGPEGHPAPSGDDGVESRSSFEWDRIPPSTAVVETVAEATGVDPTDLEPLYDTLDPGALDALIVSGHGEDHRADPTVSFTFAGYFVSIHGTGEVVVRTAPETSRTPG